MRTQLVNFYCDDGVILNGAIFEPDVKSKKIVIYTHGSARNYYENNFIRLLASTACMEDCAFLSFNNRGAEYVKDFKTIKNVSKRIGFKFEKMEDSEFDINGAINFAKKLGYTNIILCGHSLGAIKVCHFVLTNEFAGKLILLSPFDTQAILSAKCKQSFLKHGNVVEDVIAGFDVSRETFENIWSENSAGDLFKIRELRLNKYLKMAENKTLICLGKKDFCFNQFNMQEVKNFFECQFKNSKVKVFESGHSFEEALLELSQEFGSFIK